MPPVDARVDKSQDNTLAGVRCAIKRSALELISVYFRHAFIEQRLILFCQRDVPHTSHHRKLGNLVQRCRCCKKLACHRIRLYADLQCIVEIAVIYDHFVHPRVLIDHGSHRMKFSQHSAAAVRILQCL